MKKHVHWLTDWFQSYLRERTQIVNVNGVDSDPMTVRCGVPQGSILGPLLFLCYVNDMPISVKCKLLLYADDSALLVSGKDPTEIGKRLSYELESCSQWLIDNKLSLHLGKTEAILFGSKRKLKKAKRFSVSCSGTTIENQPSVKYLGATLDQCLSGESMAKGVIKKTNSRLKFLYRQAKTFTERTKKTLCASLIQCHFDYSCSSWFSSLTKILTNKIQVSQNNMVRFIRNMDSRTHIGQNTLDSLGMLNVCDRVTQLKMNHAYKIFNNTSTTYMAEPFVRVQDTNNHFTRHSLQNFVLPKPNGRIQDTFYYTAISNWNSLPGYIKCAPSQSSFKHNVKKYLSEKSSFNN